MFWLLRKILEKNWDWKVGVTFKDLVASTRELKGQSWCAWAASCLLTTERQLSRGPVLNRLLEEKSPEGDSCFLHRGESMSHVTWSWCVWYAQGRPTSPPRRERERRKDERLMKEVNKQNLTDDHCNTILIYFCTFISLFYGSNTYSLYKSDSLRLKSFTRQMWQPSKAWNSLPCLLGLTQDWISVNLIPRHAYLFSWLVLPIEILTSLYLFIYIYSLLKSQTSFGCWAVCDQWDCSFWIVRATFTQNSLILPL